MPTLMDGLAIDEVGSGEQLVVLVHGAFDSGRSFGRVVDLLSPEYRVVSYDRRGYGRSANAGGGPVGVDGHADDLVRILDGRRAILVGHSFGGVTVIGAALRAPDLVEAVALYETPLAWLPDWDDTPVQTLLGQPDPADAALRMMLADRFHTLSEADRAQRRLDAEAFVAEERSVRTGEAPFDAADLQVPLVYGRSTTAAMRIAAQHLQQVVPVCEILDIPDAGHYAHRTAPEAFAQIVHRASELARSSSADAHADKESTWPPHS